MRWRGTRRETAHLRCAGCMCAMYMNPLYPDVDCHPPPPLRKSMHPPPPPPVILPSSTRRDCKALPPRMPRTHVNHCALNRKLSTIHPEPQTLNPKPPPPTRNQFTLNHTPKPPNPREKFLMELGQIFGTLEISVMLSMWIDEQLHTLHLFPDPLSTAPQAHRNLISKHF